MVIRFHAICRPVCLIAVATIVATLAGPALAVPTEVKTATDITPYRNALEEFIKREVERLSSGLPEQQSAARNTLVQEILVGSAIREGLSTATPAYLDAYADILNRELMALTKHPSTRVRLNAVIAAARAAQYSDNRRLAEVLGVFLDDKSDAVVLWATKGARYVIPALLRPPFNKADAEIIQKVVSAARNHSTGAIAGAIAIDAYSALTLDVDSGRRGRPTDEMFKATLDDVHDLLAVRLEQFKNGVPSNPQAERRPVSWLSDGSVWTIQTSEQRLRTMQLLSDLASLAAQQTPTASEADRRELAQLIQTTARAISVAAERAGATAVVEAARPATGIQPATSASEIVERVERIFPAMAQSTAFASLKEPPKITDTRPAPPPAGEETVPSPTTPSFP